MRDCRQPAPVPSTKIYYHYEQVGHMKVNYLLLASKLAYALTSASLRITDGHQGGVELPRLEVMLSGSL